MNTHFFQISLVNDFVMLAANFFLFGYPANPIDFVKRFRQAKKSYSIYWCATDFSLIFSQKRERDKQSNKKATTAVETQADDLKSTMPNTSIIFWGIFSPATAIII